MFHALGCKIGDNMKYFITFLLVILPFHTIVASKVNPLSFVQAFLPVFAIFTLSGNISKTKLIKSLKPLFP